VGNVFTPLVALPKESLPEDVITILGQAAKQKDSCVLEQSKAFKVVAGDNAAEGLQGHLNNALRRHGLKGRSHVPTVATLSAAAVLRNPGFDAVLQAVSDYRKACSNGTLLISPSQAFSKHPCWLPDRNPRVACQKKPASKKTMKTTMKAA
jgi:hypothetical protein